MLIWVCGRAGITIFVVDLAGKAVAKALAWAVAIPAQRFRICSHLEATVRLAQDNFLNLPPRLLSPLWWQGIAGGGCNLQKKKKNQLANNSPWQPPCTLINDTNTIV